MHAVNILETFYKELTYFLKIGLKLFLNMHFYFLSSWYILYIQANASFWYKKIHWNLKVYIICQIWPGLDKCGHYVATDDQIILSCFFFLVFFCCFFRVWFIWRTLFVSVLCVSVHYRVVIKNYIGIKNV